MPALLMPLAASLAVFGAAEPERPAEFAWFAEGESCASHTWSAPVTNNADYAVCYGGGMLVVAKAEDPPEGGYAARFKAKVAEPGTYILWVAATPPGAGSPLAVSVDAQPAVPVSSAGEGTWGPGGCFRWLEAASVGLEAGEHEITVLATGRRSSDNQYYAYLDALGLERVGLNAKQPLTTFPPDVEVGPMPIRSYSGNGSVGLFMQYWGTQKGGSAGEVDDALIALLKRCGCTGYCDYQAWCRAEEQPGKWDWTFYRDNARKLRAAGLEYVPFCWLHFPPKWAEPGKDFVPYKCLEHGLELRQSSLWAPQTLATYDEYYRRLAADFGEEIAYIRLAVPSEYGELGMPIGMTTWVVPQEHIHGGYWCGDDFALADFRRAAQELAGELPALNARWGTEFATWEDVRPPDVRDHQAARDAVANPTPQKVRRWLDFVDWYQDSVIGFADKAAGVVRRHLPGKEIIMSLGYGQEPVPWGNDQSRFIRRFGELGISAQTPGDIGYFATRRVSTACRAYGVPYYTEPPGSVDRRHEVRRLFIDASNGTQAWFDYPQNLDGARDLLRENKQHLTGHAPVCDVAFLLPSSWWWLRPEWPWPKATEPFAEGLRDVMDYEVVDELLVRDGALRKLGSRLLVLVEGDLLRRDTLEALERWMREGGVFLVLSEPVLKDLDGSTDIFERLLALAQPGGPAQGYPLESVHACWSAGREVGKGRALAYPLGDGVAAKAVVVDLTYHMSALDPARRDAPLIDGEADGIWATLLPDRALYYNTSKSLIRKRVSFRPEDFPAGKPRPDRWEAELAIPGGSIAAITMTPP